MKVKHFFFPLALLALQLAACDKMNDVTFEEHDTWTGGPSEAFWDKQQGGGILVDTAWNSDTTINF